MDQFPKNRGVFFLLSCFCRLGPFWFQYDWPQTRITLALRIHSSGNWPLWHWRCPKVVLRGKVSRTYTRELTKLSPLFSINTHPPPRLCKCLGIYSICLSSWPLTMVKLGQSPQFASCTDWLIRKFSNRNHRFWVRGWWLRTKQIRIMNMNAVHVNGVCIELSLLKGCAITPLIATEIQSKIQHPQQIFLHFPASYVRLPEGTLNNKARITLILTIFLKRMGK